MMDTGTTSGRTSSSSDSDEIPAPSPTECTGRAAVALDRFRQREAALKRIDQRKSDMVAYKELRGEWCPSQQHGHIEGVPIGLRLNGRGEAAIVGIHTQILRGIDAVRGESCYAVCVSGKYVDDDDRTSDGSLVYTGVGGRNKKGHQVQDQKETVGNASLLRSIETQLPIRVLRGRTQSGKSPEYFYDGLYKCTSSSYEPSADGPRVYKFNLLPIENESKARSIMVASMKSSTVGGTRRRLFHEREGVDGYSASSKQQRRDSTKTLK